ncbi:helix-turn-helix domain-containing protein [Dolichospermum compactum]|uniref:Putative XRE family transcriptional regulator n=1 Tax=Dolichospermum compactum NIES-806 TaxID=1973481 RepID=A0A1Z4V216_9CYAN|nr:helix-turn-helix transcriptional regulator [Dolichospermum compactum]BAZ85473.1 putative XRE family transcriptional regulator [Dolichospermum compactum NIES-806]
MHNYNTEKIEIKTSSGNVFADLDLPNPEEMLVKAELARKISNAIIARHITQAEAAELLGIDQPKVSALMRGRLAGFSLERMFRFLNTLGIDVEITVKPKLRDNARITVV